MTADRGTLRGRIGWWLRKWADRIDHRGAPKLTHWSFTFEHGLGQRFREDGKGCRLAYLGEAEYERAHAEADNPPPRVDWLNGTVSRPNRDRGVCPACDQLAQIDLDSVGVVVMGRHIGRGGRGRWCSGWRQPPRWLRADIAKRYDPYQLLSATSLYSEEREFHATCPLCSEPSQVLEFDRYDPDVVFDAPGVRGEPRLMAFAMACGCKVPARDWVLRVELEPRRTWFEAAQR